MKKKFMLTLTLCLSTLVLFACGNTAGAADAGNEMTVNTQIIQSTEQIIEVLDEAVRSGDIEAYAKQFESQYSMYGLTGTGEELLNGASQWQGALNDIGTYEGVDENSVDINGTNDDFTVTCEIRGSERGAEVIMHYAVDNMVLIPEITINPHYTLGELMENAALNTLLGMGTVFAVLILIMFIIMCFGIFPKIEAAKAKKQAAKAENGAGVDNAIAQIIENEELSDDDELVAVISAAIAAFEGSTGGSTDGFVVRSIRRANTNHWQRA